MENFIIRRFWREIYKFFKKIGQSFSRDFRSLSGWIWDKVVQLSKIRIIGGIEAYWGYVAWRPSILDCKTVKFLIRCNMADGTGKQKQYGGTGHHESEFYK